jgi:hypothetical protein
MFCPFCLSFIAVSLNGRRVLLVRAFISPMSLAPIWFSSSIPFVREGALSSTMAYLSGRIMVLVELLGGSSSKTRVPFAGS